MPRGARRLRRARQPRPRGPRDRARGQRHRLLRRLRPRVICGADDNNNVPPVSSQASRRDPGEPGSGRPGQLRARPPGARSTRRWSPETTTRPPSGTRSPTIQMMSRNVRGFMSLFWSEKPVICKVHGYCVAGGTDMALCSDLLVVEDRAKIGYPPARVWGVPTTALWAHRIGPARAKRLLLTGDSIDGTTAVEWGLATEAAPAAELDAAFESLLERVARLPINQLVMHKLLVNQAVAAQGLAVDPGAGHVLRRDRPPHAGGPRVRAPRRRARASSRRSAIATSRSATSGSTGRPAAVKVLITSSRMPFALGMVRQLARRPGTRCYAADDYKQAPGSHSKYLAGHFVYPSAAAETEAFIDELERIIAENEIDVVVPAFEEAFFISTQRERLSKRGDDLRGAVRGARAPARQGRLRAARARRSGCRFPRRSSRPPTRSSPRRSSAGRGTSAARCSRAAGSTCSPTRVRSPGCWIRPTCIRRRRSPGWSSRSSRARRCAPTRPSTTVPSAPT